MMDEIGELLWRLLGGVLILVIVAVFVENVANVGLAPQLGDPFFSAWHDVTHYGWQALIWIVPGVGAAAYVVLKLVEDASGF
jgi:hypothetical protein